MVHGQPVFPGGGGGSSFNVGQRIVIADYASVTEPYHSFQTRS